MSAELLILLGAIIGAFLVILVFQIRKLLIEKQVNLSDLDSVIIAIFDLKLDKQFFLKLAFGTLIGIGGAILAGNALYAGAPLDGTEIQLLGYGIAWGFAGNGILKLMMMFPEGLLGVLKLNETIKVQRQELKTLKSENQALSSQVNSLNEVNQGLLEQAISNQKHEHTTFPQEAQPVQENPNREVPLKNRVINTEQYTNNVDGTKTI